MRRMISGTFPSLPNVCHYDDLQDILRESVRIQKKDRELTQMGFTPLLMLEKTSKTAGGSGEEDHPAPRSKSLEAWKEGGRRKTWPERRRERREVKRLRREAQARREGGLQTIKGLGFDVEGHFEEPFRSHNRDPTPPPQKKKMNSQERGRKSHSREKTRKSREAERWKTRGGMKHGDLYLRDDLGPMDEGLLSPKHRVRHRKR